MMITVQLREVVGEGDEDPLEDGDPSAIFRPPRSRTTAACSARWQRDVTHARNLPRWPHDPDPATRLDSRGSLGRRRVVEQPVDRPDRRR
jgi:hypothetical protein